MSWLKLDDAMAGHRKTRRLIRGAGGLQAFGLHTLALLHCSAYTTDGFVEAEFVEETLDHVGVRGKRRTQLVAALVTGGQWLSVDGGWAIHDYLDHNPSRADVEARRAKDAERKARGRDTQSTSHTASVRPDTARTQPGPTSERDRTAVGVRVESDGPVPSRPVPSVPPLPPEGETAPSRPSGTRQRDLDVWRSEMAGWAQQHFPASTPEQVEVAADWIASKGRPVTVDALRRLGASSESWASTLGLDAEPGLTDGQRHVLADVGAQAVELNRRAEA